MTARPKSLTIASRGSRLALAQAELVADLVRAAEPSLEVRIETVTTRGDQDQRPFSAIGGKGLFMGEVERAVLEGSADLAVHSAKDLTAELGPGCVIGCVPSRGPVHDVVIGGEGVTGEDRLGALPSSAVVGTSSMRRRALLGGLRPDLELVELRGNVDTRLAKVARGEAAVALLAAAGVERLSLNDAPVAGPLDPERWIPAPGQGALAVEVRAERTDLLALLEPINDHLASAELRCERAFAAELEGGCSVPLGCLARAVDRRLVATGFLSSPEGGFSLRDRISGPAADAETLGRELARSILDAGGAELLEEIRTTPATQPSPP